MEEGTKETGDKGGMEDGEKEEGEWKKEVGKKGLIQLPEKYS